MSGTRDKLVESILCGEGEIKKEKRSKEIDVNRPLDQENDLGNLLGVERNELPNESQIDDKFLIGLARENVQLLFNDLMDLESERVEEVIVAKLPHPLMKLPREKPLPKPKPLTKWEQFAKEKGIQKTSDKKKPKLVWDDQVREWVPRFGYKKAQAEVKKTWCVEYKGNAPDNEDPFEKMAKEKQEKIAKNEMQRLRNIARSQNVKIPQTGLGPSIKTKNSSELSNAADLAQKSTASLGKFQEKISSKLEKKAKKPRGKKRQFEPVIGDSQKEKSNNMKILRNMEAKKQKIDISKAVGQHINMEDRQRSEDKKSRGGGRGGKNKKRNKSR